MAADWLPDAFDPGLVSVVIPTRNRAHFIGETLESVLAQTYEKIEIAVVDDDSSDDTRDVVDKWRRRFLEERGWKLRLIEQEHKGAPAARNLGAATSRGEFINFLDDDDLLSHNNIEKLVKTLAGTEADIAYSPYVPFYRCSGGYWVSPPHNAVPLPNEDRISGLLHQRAWLAPGSVMTRAFVGKVGPWDEALTRGQDSEYRFRCAFHDARLVHCPEGIMWYRQHRSGSITKDRNVKAHMSLVKVAEGVEAYLEAKGTIKQYRSDLATYWCHLALHLYAERDVGLGRVCEARMTEHDAGYVPDGISVLSKIAHSLGGVRALALKNRAIRAFWEALPESIRLHALGYRPKRELALVL